MPRYLNKKVVLIAGTIIALALTTPFLRSGDVKVEQLRLEDGLAIDFTHTDDNSGESIIIKSDKEIYEGPGQSDVYFALTNTGSESEKIAILSYFPKEFGDVNNIEVWENGRWQNMPIVRGDIKANISKLKKALDRKKAVPETFNVKAGTQFEISSGHTAYFKSQISYPIGEKGEFWFEAFGDQGGYGLLDPTFYGTTVSADTKSGWYSSTFAYRKKITIDSKKVSGGANLSNFPVLISHTDLDIRTTTFGGKSASGSGEFIFTSSNGTSSLPYEIEKYSSVSGQFIGWVNVTTLSASTETQIYMYYGGVAAGGATNQNKSGTWNSAYKSVWHLGDVATPAVESTSANHATQSGGVTFASTGKIGNAVSLVSGSSQYLSASSTNLQGTTYTYEVWANVTSLPSATSYKGVFGIGDTATGDQAIVVANNYASGPALTGWSYVTYNTDATNFHNSIGTAPLTNRWYHLVLTRDDSNVILYVDGSPAVQDANGVKVATFGTPNTVIGARPGVSNYFDGYIDELRVSNSARTAGWIKTEYNNQISPRTFYGLGQRENKTPSTVRYGTTTSADTKSGWYSSTFGYRKKITLDYKKVSGGANLSNFPVLISHTDLDIRTTAFGGKSASGSGEFIFTSSDGSTSLPYEIEKYSSVSGQFIGWVNVTTLSATADTYLYMYYGGAASGGATNQNKTGTWDSNYKMVLHLKEKAACAVTFRDSTSNANSGTCGDSPAYISSAKIGDARSTDGTNDYINVAGGGGLNNQDPYTISMWVKWSGTQDAGFGDNVFGAIGARQSNGIFTHNLIGLDGSNPGTAHLRFAPLNRTVPLDAPTVVGNGRWRYVAFYHTTGSQIIYLDGLADKLGTQSGAAADNSAIPFTPGAWIGDGGSFSTAVMDEIRVSNNQRVAGWLRTEYNNQNSPRTFYALGMQEGKTPANPNIQIK